jgi:chromosome segregation ATPase
MKTNSCWGIAAPYPSDQAEAGQNLIPRSRADLDTGAHTSMSDPSHVARSLRERLGGNTEERLGKALSDLLENPLLTGAIGRAFDAREKAVQAQEVAMGALNIPSAADIERLTRRLRSVSLRLEGIEEGVDRLDRTRTPADAEGSEIAERLSAIEDQLKRLSDRLDREPKTRGAAKAATKPAVKAAAKAAAKPRPSKAKAKPAKA